MTLPLPLRMNLAELILHRPLPDVLVFVGSPLKVNVTVLIGGDEAVVVDSTATISQARQVYSHVVDELGLRVVAVVNTHWHSDHCGGNAGLASAGAPVIAHRRHFETISLERNMVSRRPARIAFERLVGPRIAMDRRLDLYLGERMVHLLHAPGHSPDLVMVWDPTRGVLIASDNLLAGDQPDDPAIPYFYWGDPWRLIGALEHARSLSPELVVPGHGAPIPPKYVEHALHNAIGYLHWLLERVEGLSRDLSLDVEDEPPPTWLEAAPLSEYLGGSAPSDWVSRMHELNLLRVYLGVEYANP